MYLNFHIFNNIRENLLDWRYTNIKFIWVHNSNIVCHTKKKEKPFFHHIDIQHVMEDFY